MLKCNLFLWSKLYFQHHYSSLQCHMIFRNHSNMLICCSRNISDYYQCWKQLCCPIFLWKPWCILFFTILWWIESSKEQHLFETEIFCNIINVFTVTFDQFNVSSQKTLTDPKLHFCCECGVSLFVWEFHIIKSSFFSQHNINDLFSSFD